MIMGASDFIKYAHNLIRIHYMNEFNITLMPEDIYTVWVSKALQNNKGMFSTTVSDGRYIEVTYNGDKEEFYFDCYKKEINTPITLEEMEGMIDE